MISIFQLSWVIEMNEILHVFSFLCEAESSVLLCVGQMKSDWFINVLV